MQNLILCLSLVTFVRRFADDSEW